MGKDRLIPLLALIVLLIGTFSTIYVNANLSNKKTITINGEAYTIDKIFLIATEKTITIDGINITGVALDDLVYKTNIQCPSCNRYIIRGADGYQQIVSWDSMQNGILTTSKRVYFSDLARSFWVRDVIEFEAI
jgi:hypothetical protein